MKRKGCLFQRGKKEIRYVPVDFGVFGDQTLPSTEKVLSLSDGSAAFIQKGSRNPLKRARDDRRSTL